MIKAKDSREVKADEPRSLKNTEYNILKNIKINNPKDFEQEDELKELINTITNTSLLNKIGDRELSLKMFDELRANTMYENSSSIKTILEEEPKEKTGEMDHSFFTSSLNLKDKDFDQLQNLNKSVHKNGKLINAILTTLFIIIAVALILIIYIIVK